MAELRYLRPAPVSLPEDGPLARRFIDPRQHLPGRPPLEAADYSTYDRHGIFHDVFLSLDGRAVEAIGPPLVNLAHEILPLQATLVDSEVRTGAPLRHRLHRFDRVTVHRFELPASHHDRDSLTIRFRFANALIVERALRRFELEPVNLQFTTIQRDNPPEWIVDWVRYLADVGVDRVLLYDNASRDSNGLRLALVAAALPIPVVLVEWKPTYGPHRSYYNRFCQATQNNHALRCLGQATWTGFFDVDEYPVVGSPSGPLDFHGRYRRAPDLRDLLARAGRRTGLVRLDSYWMPDLREDSTTADTRPSVRDFTLRERAARGKAHKYIARTQALRMANTHNGRLRLGWFSRTLAPSIAHFLHYKPLTTNWRDFGRRGDREPLDTALHVADRSVTDRFDVIDEQSAPCAQACGPDLGAASPEKCEPVEPVREPTSGHRRR